MGQKDPNMGPLDPVRFNLSEQCPAVDTQNGCDLGFVPLVFLEQFFDVFFFETRLCGS
jgi:hypothetical protein